MGVYILKRLFLIVPTLFGIMLMTFAVIQFVPGGPVDQIIAQLTGQETDATARITGGGGGDMGDASGDSDASMHSAYEGARGLDPDFVKELEKQFGFDEPAHKRFFKMLWDYIRLDFGTSFFQDRSVISLLIERLPVSISLGFWTLVIHYGICIPLGVAKAVRDGTPFDIWTSAAIFIGFAIPQFLFAILLIVLFAGGNYWDFFPLRGLTSFYFDDLSTWGKIKDYFWHLVLPIAAMVLSGFAVLTMLTKNLFLEEISKQFVLTARAKGLTERRVLYGHVFRNAMLIIIAQMPGALVHILFTGALLIEIIFSLNGIGLLGFEAIVSRDYPIVLGTLFMFSLIGLVMHLIGDITYVLVDPRIDFETREV
ncbi:MAG: microcin C ABC transporter permease YejB [Pseudomonadales bacterium]|jgi:microcin C transport system permease protein|nr:microcin C ABC transporter permease YejB [Pseudomonadales bacterium]MDP7146065.1 microcin C ABC transporter permease YejB [Pseudomonadales bacterium]MDP7360945.1 microcin C ABC transporter permease YejB [Pseudomonadales bacterium]MDP7595271.1 microcin C ABC transporter permease YejB [Pseudomonadales bacterium]HJN49533.1 microcin C ABC transporter permease YejB [Pseudomonadales bacterium]|tara:strand:+ start:970 stop:2073 length:1104 start_codon:yes stop_codon:yes gene_type:complete